MDKETATKILNDYLKLYYRITIDDVRITDVRGYWEDKEPCDRNACHHPIHGCMFNEGTARHTYQFAEWGLRDKRGRIMSPFRVWDTLHESMHGAPTK